MTPEPNAAIPSMWRLLSATQRRSAVELLALMLFGMLFETFGVGMVIPAIALLTQADYAAKYPALLEWLGHPTPRTLVIIGIATLVSLYVVKCIYLAWLAWRQMRFAFGVHADLAQRLFTVYLRQPYTFHLQRNSSQLVHTATREIELFTYGAVIPGMLLLTESLVLIGLCSLLLFVEPVGALIVVATLGSAAWVFHRLTRGRISRWGLARQHHEGLRLQHLQQGLGGAKDVKLLGREEEFLDQFRLHNSQSARVGHLQSTLLQIPRLWLELLAVSGLAILVVSMLMQGRALASILPTLGLFAAAAFRLIPSANRLIGAVQSLRFAYPVITVLHRELTIDAPPPVAAVTAPAPFEETLALCDVTYTYPGASSPALSHVSLAIARGESIGFVGPSGAGKSTLVDLLLGLLAPCSGEVRVDGRDIQANLRGWQDRIGYVPQSIYLTDDTLMRNVAFGLPNEQIDEAAVKRAIKAAQLEDFVASLPEGLQTTVGERGIRLSGGQRQRIGIARALYHDPSVLVLDEATSALDTATEHGIMEAVYALHGAKTLLIVAHRLSTVEYCDRLYRLEGGRLVPEVPAGGRVGEAARA